MDFFDTILGMFGVGQPKLTATASQTTLGPGAQVTVDIKLEGGKRELPLSALVLELKSEKKLKDNQKSWDTLAEERVYLGGQPIRPGEVLEARITLQVPAKTSASGGALSHKLVASADVPGWEPDASIPVTITPSADPLAAEDCARYHVLPAERSFRHSSVRGDFRVFPLPDGGVALGWKSLLVCRSGDGQERWRCGFGRTATVSPDGRTIAAANQSKQIGLIDVATGTVQQTIDVGDWVNNIAWVTDGLACNCTSKIVVVSTEGAVLREITTLGKGEPFIGSLAGAGDQLLAIDSNAQLLVSLDPATGGIRGSQPLSFHPADVYQVGSKIVVDSNGRVAIGDDIAVSKGFKMIGRQGIRYVGQSEHSYTHFKPNARLSPNHQRVLLNDQSGLLWLLAADGKPIRTWPREQLDFVEDTGWLDDQHFVAITNDGRSHRVDTQTGAIAWSQQDA